jgi:DNA-binding LacI/PurR family transcriptional regulator
MIEHLIKVHGKQRIIFMHGPRNQEDSYWRFMGYEKALKENGISLDPELILEGGFERDVAFKNLIEFLNKNPKFDFDAIFAGDDDAAVGVLSALKEKGYRVPDDIAVVGFDDSRLSAFLNPPLTTVRAPTEKVGITAAKQLFEHLNGRDHSDETVLLPTELIIRRSCGCLQDSNGETA